jgi:hypothetical protein
MEETEIPLHNDPFLQGDIVRLMDNDERAVDPGFGIIINADCDLAHCKIDGVVSYLPLFPFDDYFRRFWVPSFIAERKLELLQSIAQICGLEKDQANELERWVLEEDVNEVVSKLAATYSIRHGVIRPKVLELHAIAHSSEYDLQLLLRLVELQLLKKEEALAKYAKRALKGLGDGHFFINEIAGVAPVGFVARMRRTYSIGDDVVYPSIAEFRLRKPGAIAAKYAIRIARLSNLYRYKIAQLFAYQFSRIGLPDEITALNELAVQAAVLSVGGEIV